MQTKRTAQKTRSSSIQPMLAALCRQHNCRVEDLQDWKAYPDGRLVVILPNGAKIIHIIKP